ncbi:saccharopine dehydrogenase NADP-binding domain-containing protein [Streptomyces sp. NBC_00654]|uniref:saccharopine dehydrogenase NADP-binding domain-containing protein n=1 Tax=Streptomyces sp. NBC_00654 TaxID=2975799 RepID=UPI002B1DA52A|nr:saccharopine dehydrogenase NADP-binding domain-containing protein [Streptomyces sp. NBC_00654]
MPEPITEASGTVHWVGTGLSTGSGLWVLAGTARTVVVWGRTEDRAQSCLSRLGMTGHSAVRAYDPARLAGELRAGDVVVSMLPATEHPVLLRLCTERNAHFACSSYASIARILDGDAPPACGWPPRTARTPGGGWTSSARTASAGGTTRAPHRLRHRTGAPEQAPSPKAPEQAPHQAPTQEITQT